MAEFDIDISREPNAFEVAMSSEQKNIGVDLPGDLVFGVPGKSAYEYAREGGYTGSEEEFRKKMAELGNFTGGVDFETDASLTLENGILSVNTIDQVIEDDVRPVTSGAVYQEFSKAVALLKTI